MRAPSPNNPKETQETEKVPFLVVKRIREAILDELFKPGEWLTEPELAKKFEVSRSPVREALLALEKEGTVTMSPYKGAIVTPLSVAEGLDLAELRLALISLALRPAHRHLSPADFDYAYDLAKRLTRLRSAKEHFECNRRFWDIIFSKAQRPILHEVFQQLENRSTRYAPLILKLFPAETRPRQHELLIEIYREGKIAEAFRAYREIFLEMVNVSVHYIQDQEAGQIAAPIVARHRRKEDNRSEFIWSKRLNP
jgi:DNA-binding GntR family transcriptional regulator